MFTVKSSDSVKGDVTVMQPVQVTVPAAFFITVQVAVAVTVKSSDSVKGDVTVKETVQITVQVATVVAVQNKLRSKVLCRQIQLYIFPGLIFH